MWLLLIFIVIPIIEIGLFIQVGGWLGLWPTLLIVILTAYLGTRLLRKQGLETLARLQGSVASGENPLDPIAHAALILVAGVLLLTPGFFTDAIGFSLLLPPVRVALVKWGATRILQSNTVIFTSAGQPPTGQPPNKGTLDGEFTVLDDPEETPGNSGWTKPDK